MVLKIQQQVLQTVALLQATTYH